MQNAVITIQNRETQEYRTFRISTAKKMDNKQIISILAGPDNEYDYQGFGFISDTGINVWKKYKQDTDATKWLYYAMLIESLLNIRQNTIKADKYTMQLSKRCMVCNRPLTTPESLERGIGPECASK